MWGLKKKADRQKGDVLTYRDERGELFRVKLVGSLPIKLSVFQGSVLIPMRDFTRRYPSQNGYRMFLVDVRNGKEADAKAVLSGRLGRLGIDFGSTVDRLREFYTVESTYMAMFLVLGGLGLLLGSVGVGVVVLRNIAERRNEFGILEAVGYSGRDVRRVILAEHWLILGMGLAVGIISSLAAMWPNIVSAGVRLPYTAMAVLLAGILLFQVVWILVPVVLALKTPLINALRNE
jgi:ABC-type antimicrobial peptide transport system permease subunit